ncbi:hypothetical protein BDU57DRAFT_519987 [Ampelomyces quisqualis]|uniref:Magnesium transporter n=1 Tax=Ampelomyces quisqualis TaxID=50730 RepID=A0A6A5QGU0_AMPQU|nr:hypothetical protein BDU57DRAFT_519987 [Ampelomyces quisqualis]
MSLNNATRCARSQLLCAASSARGTLLNTHPSPATRLCRWIYPSGQRNFERRGLHTPHIHNSLRRLSTLSATSTNDADSAQQLYDLSCGLSRTQMNGNAEVQYSTYNAKNGVKHGNNMNKFSLASEYGLSTRDIRTIDLPSDGFPQIMIRQSALLIFMFDLRLLVQADRLLVFHVAENGGFEQDNTSRVFNQSLEGKLRGEAGLGVSIDLPFELRVLEAALASVTSTLEAEYQIANKQVSKALQALKLQMQGEEEDAIHSELHTLLGLVRKLSSIEQRASHVRGEVQEVLNEDRDMADMYLSDKQAGKPHAIQDHQEVEYLLEAYYKASDAVVQEAASLKAEIQQTDETIQSMLNVRRNQIMVLEAKIEIMMLGLASATLVAGLYGMNVINYSEQSPWAFGVLVSSSLIGTLLISRYGLRQLKRIQKMRL